MHLPNAFKCFLQLDSKYHIMAHKSKRFVKVRGILKLYLTDLIKVSITFYFYCKLTVKSITYTRVNRYILFTDTAKRSISQYYYCASKASSSNVTLHSIVLVFNKATIKNFVEAVVNRRRNCSRCSFLKYITYRN